MADRVVLIDEVTGKLKATENLPTAFYIPFDFNDLAGGSKLIGKVSPSKILERIDIIIENKFAPGVTVSVGDAIDNSRIMKITENKPQHISMYEKPLNYKYTIETNVYLYFTGISLIGNGIAVLHFN